MTGKTHQAIGLTVGVGWYLLQANPTYQPATLAAVTFGASLAALLPDIDTAGGALYDLLPLGHAVGHVIDPFLKHRNITHSFLGFGLVETGFYFLLKSFPPYWGIDTHALFVATFLSYASHLLADMFTEEGIPLLFPYPQMFGLPPKPFEHARIKTGRWFENLIIFPAVNVMFITLLIIKFPAIKTILFK